jgi:hypothetical protein
MRTGRGSLAQRRLARQDPSKSRVPVEALKSHLLLVGETESKTN